jgi:hypothetical protein
MFPSRNATICNSLGCKSRFTHPTSYQVPTARHAIAWDANPRSTNPTSSRVPTARHLNSWDANLSSQESGISRNAAASCKTSGSTASGCASESTCSSWGDARCTNNQFGTKSEGTQAVSMAMVIAGRRARGACGVLFRLAGFEFHVSACRAITWDLHRIELLSPDSCLLTPSI